MSPNILYKMRVKTAIYFVVRQYILNKNSRIAYKTAVRSVAAIDDK